MVQEGSDARVFNVTASTGIGLDLDQVSSSKLYGRHDECQKVSEAYGRRLTEKEIVLITGSSGSGKTSIARSIEPTVRKDGGYLAVGKFEQNKSEPYSAFVDAFSSILHQTRAKGEVEPLRNKFAESMAQLSPLWQACPAMYEIVFPVDKGNENTKVVPKNVFVTSSASTSTFPADSSGRKNAFILAWRKFVATICSIGPIVLVLDDLQWCDNSSMALLDALVGKSMKTPFLLIATCRGNELLFEDGIAETLSTLEGNGVKIIGIKVGNLTKEVVERMVSDILKTPLEESVHLTDLIWRHTEGNPFFVKQLLQSLADQNLIEQTKTGEGRRWRWDENKLRASGLFSLQSDRQAVDLVKKRIQRLPEDLQDVLKVAASFGTIIYVNIVCHLLPYAPTRVEEVLKLAETHGLIGFESAVGVGRFSHDQIRDAAYSLIPNDSKTAFHLNNGQVLWKGLDPDTLDTHMFLVVDQLMQGDVERLEQCETDRIKTAELCYIAARKAFLSSALFAASNYMETGLILLKCKSQWTKHYQLSLEMLSLSCDIHFHSGNHDVVDDHHEEILKNAKLSSDTLQSCATHIYSLGARGDHDGAVREGLDFLQELGHPIASNRLKMRISFQYTMTALKLKGVKDDFFLGLPSASDPKVLAAMNMLCVLYTYLFMKGSEYVPLISMKMIDLTLAYGVCPFSCIGLIAFATMISNTSNSLDEAYRIGKLAMKLFESKRYKIKARVYLGYYPYLHGEKHPLRDCAKPLMEACNANLHNDVELSLRCAGMSLLMHPYLGTKLSVVIQELRDYRELCDDYSQSSAWAARKPTLQLALNLMGNDSKNDPSVLTGEAMNEEVALKQYAGLKYALALVLIQKYYLAVYLGGTTEMEVAEALMEKTLPDLSSTGVAPFALKAHVFHEGLTAVALARSSKNSAERRKRIRTAKNCLSKLTKFSTDCPFNYSNKQKLVEAELLATAGEYDRAIQCYDASIELAAQEGLVNEQALACEKAGKALLRRKVETGADPSQKGQSINTEAHSYLQRAHECYSEWGASVKVKQLDEIIQCLG